MRRISFAFLTFFALGFATIPATAQQVTPIPPGTLRLQVSDSFRMGDGSRIGLYTETNGVLKFHGNCETLADGYVSTAPLYSSCDPSDYRVKVVPSIELVAPVCRDIKSYCLENARVTLAGAEIKARFIGYQSDSRVIGIEKYGIPSGRSSSIWQFPGVLHSGGSDYYQIKLDLIAGVGRWFYLQGGKLGEDRPAEITSFELRIRPVQLVDPADAKSAMVCDSCNIPTDANFQVNAILNHDVLGMKWFYSRIRNADVDITKVQGNQYRYSISGNPMPLQLVDGRMSFSEAPKPLVALHTKRNPGCRPTSQTNSCWAYVVNGNRPWEAEELLAAWRPVLKDSATQTISQWFIRSNYQDAGQWFNDMDFYRCAPKDKAAGVVTSNALMTTGSIPALKTGVLNYQVSSLHFEEDQQTVFKGFYEFVMDEKLARCLFKFPAVPISAKITVTGSAGNEDVETVVSGVGQGKMRFVASNFTYSTKTVSIKFVPKGYKLCAKGSKALYTKSVKCPKGFRQG